MAQESIYPDALPTPQVGTFTPAGRRALSPGRPFQSRALQRDRLGTVDIVFPPMDLTNAAAFRDFWRVILEFGGNWFYAPKWPLPSGRGGVFKWLGAPRMENVANRYVRISGSCEVRGAGMLPTVHIPTIWLLNDFVTTGGSAGSRPWVLSNGDQTVFVPDEEGSLTGVENHYQGAIVSNTPRSSGKRYFELVADQIFAPDPFSFADSSISWGLVSGLFDPAPGTTALGGAESWSFLTTPLGDAYFSGDDGAGGLTVVSPLDPLIEGMVFGFAVDIDAGKLWVSIDGVWITGDPETATSPIVEDMTPAPFNIAFAAQRAYVQTTMRTIPGDFHYSLPDGFIAWAD